MFIYPVIIENYPQATVVAFTEFYHPQLRWQRIDQSVDAILQFAEFEAQIQLAITHGATQLGFVIQDEKLAHYTVYVSAKKLQGSRRIKTGKQA